MISTLRWLLLAVLETNKFTMQDDKSLFGTDDFLTEFPPVLDLLCEVYFADKKIEIGGTQNFGKR